MNLFEDKPTVIEDWYEVCPNAEGDMLDEVEAMRSFDAMLFYTREWDRAQVAEVSDKLLCSAMAFSYDGMGRVRLQFPDRKKKIPRSLYSAFGLRGNEEHWFEQLAANESFVRLVARNIKKDDWAFIMYNKGTLLKKEEKEDTAPKSVFKNKENLW